jgi:phosphotransferase system  glucose/maltose/N-acetylglucosamine-specific IIC component
MGINVLLFKVIDFKDRWIQYILILLVLLYLMFSIILFIRLIKKFNKKTAHDSIQ